MKENDIKQKFREASNHERRLREIHEQREFWRQVRIISWLFLLWFVLMALWAISPASGQGVSMTEAYGYEETETRPCANCGEPIPSGIICRDCAAGLEADPPPHTNILAAHHLMEELVDTKLSEFNATILTMRAECALLAGMTQKQTEKQRQAVLKDLREELDGMECYEHERAWLAIVAYFEEMAAHFEKLKKEHLRAERRKRLHHDRWLKNRPPEERKRRPRRKSYNYQLSGVGDVYRSARERAYRHTGN